jgi:hypothetical protein
MTTVTEWRSMRQRNRIEAGNSMFNVGDTVRNVTANVVGVVVELDGDTVYLEQSNGCEVDFDASSLVLENDFQTKHGTDVRKDAGSRENDAVYSAVIDNLYPATVQLGQTAHANEPRVLGIVPKGWHALSSLQKLNAISKAANIPVKTWLDSNQSGADTNIGTLQLSVLAAASKKERP